MLLSDVIEDYLRHIQHERRLSKKTYKGYQAWLHNLHGWLQSNGYPEHHLCDYAMPIQICYFYHMAGKGYRPRTLWSVVQPVCRLQG